MILIPVSTKANYIRLRNIIIFVYVFHTENNAKIGDQQYEGFSLCGMAPTSIPIGLQTRKSTETKMHLWLHTYRKQWKTGSYTWAKDRPPIPHFMASVVWGSEVSKVRSLTELCVLRVSVETYVASKGWLQCKICQHFRRMQRIYGFAPGCVACGGSHFSGGCSTPREQPKCCGCMRNDTAKYWGCIKRNEVKAALANQAPEHGRKSGATGYLDASKAQRARPFAEHMDLGERWNRRPRRALSRQLPLYPQTKSLPSACNAGARVA